MYLAKRGMTLIELTLAMAIFSIVSMGAASSFSAMSLNVAATENETNAQNTAQQALEEALSVARRFATTSNGYLFTYDNAKLRATYLNALVAYYHPQCVAEGTGFSFEEYFHYLEQTPSTGQNLNATFDVAGLSPQTGDFRVGQILVYLDESSVPSAFGSVNGKLDLNGDGLYGDLSQPSIGAVAVSGENSYVGSFNIKRLPIEVRLTWQDNKGVHSVQRYSLVSSVEN